MFPVDDPLRRTAAMASTLIDGVKSQILVEDYKPKHYHRLAAIMADTRDLAIFRRFDDIAALRLLSLQAEILGLQAAFQYQCKENDMSQDVELKKYSQSFKQLNIGRDQDAQQALVMDKMFSKLDQYCKQPFLRIISDESNNHRTDHCVIQGMRRASISNS